MLWCRMMTVCFYAVSQHIKQKAGFFCFLPYAAAQHAVHAVCCNIDHKAGRLSQVSVLLPNPMA